MTEYCHKQSKYLRLIKSTHKLSIYNIVNMYMHPSKYRKKYWALENVSHL